MTGDSLGKVMYGRWKVFQHFFLSRHTYYFHISKYVFPKAKGIFPLALKLNANFLHQTLLFFTPRGCDNIFLVRNIEFTEWPYQERDVQSSLISNHPRFLLISKKWLTLEKNETKLCVIIL